uniref:Uncharacterized protein n=1 Tax=Salmonella phage vB_SE130_2P TaxID=3236707 RepID=A0AB39C424_9VIRU
MPFCTELNHLSVKAVYEDPRRSPASMNQF